MMDLDNDISIINCSVCKDIGLVHSYFSQLPCNSLGFKIIHQNIRSYRRNFDEFLVLLEGVKVRFNCIVLTEAWLDDDFEITCLDGFSEYRSYGRLNNADGVVVYIDGSLSATCTQLTLGGVATGLSLTFTWEGQTCRMLSIYRSPNSSLSLFMDGLTDYCRNKILPRDINILVGDINCNINNITTNSEEEKYLDILQSSGFVQCITVPTRPATNTCIDHIFIKIPNNTPVNVNESVVIDSALTDHCAICLQISSHCIAQYKTDQSKTISKCDWQSFRQDLAAVNWDNVIGTDNVHLSTDIFLNTIKHILQNNSKCVNKRSLDAKIKPWITTGIVRSIRYRDKLCRKLRQQPFNVTLRNKYKRYRNTLHSVIKKAKFNFYKNRIEWATGDSRKFWQVVNEVAGRPGDKGAFPVGAYCEYGDTATPDKVKEISDSFNVYFSSVGTVLAESIVPRGPAEVRDSEHSAESEFLFRPVSRQELYGVVMGLRGRSAPGWDGISTSVIKDNIDILLEPILHIVNVGLVSGEFPTALKLAKVVPIFKSGSKSLKSNFRPISLLSSLSKIIEKCVKNQLSSYLDSHSIITNIQYGFRSNINTSDALNDITRFIISKFGSPNTHNILVTFLDLAKAFDSLDRVKLLNKLKYIGVRNKSLDWFKSYFHNRLQTVAINGIISDSNLVEYGIVQGSTLGPLLFLIYINNLSKLNIQSNLFLFADDTAVVTVGNSWDSVYSLASRELIKLKNWFDHNSLTLNVNKTKCLPIFLRADYGPGQRSLTLHSCGSSESVGCACQVIETVDQHKYLGVILDHKLSWGPHIQYTSQRVRRMVYAFTQLSQVLPLDLRRTVYFAYVQSILQYGILVWGGASSSLLEPLAVAQRKIIKLILRRNMRYPSNLLYTEFTVLTLRQLFVKDLLLHIRRNKAKIFVVLNHNLVTRNRLEFGFEIPRPCSSLDYHSTFFIAHIVYKNLPQNILLLEPGSVAVYKRRVSEWLLSCTPEETERLIRSNYI